MKLTGENEERIITSFESWIDLWEREGQLPCSSHQRQTAWNSRFWLVFQQGAHLSVLLLIAVSCRAIKNMCILKEENYFMGK